MATAIYNTLKMVGVNPKDCLSFSDAYIMYHLSVNPQIKQDYRKVLLETPINGKTLIEWHKGMVNDAIKSGVKVQVLDEFTKSCIVKYSYFDFKVSNKDLQMEHVIIVFNHALQVWYKENGYDFGNELKKKAK
jgi:hypothetical protein